MIGATTLHLAALHGWMNVAVNGKFLEEVECLKYLDSHVAVDGVINEEVKFQNKRSNKGVWKNECLEVSYMREYGTDSTVWQVELGIRQQQ